MLERFFRERQDLSPGRKEYYRAVFRKVSSLVPDPYNLDREGMANLVEKLGRVLKPQAYNSHMAAIGCLYKWMGKEDVVSFVKRKPVRREDYVRALMCR